MREQFQFVSNYAFTLALAILLTSLQTTLWTQIFGVLASPHWWIPPLVYWILYRRIFEGLAMTYLITFVVSAYTSMPFGVILSINIVMFISILLIKGRFFMPGTSYYMLMCGLGAFLFTLTHVVVSHAFEPTPIADILVYDWIVRTLLTALVSLPLYNLFVGVDQWTDKVRPATTGNLI